MHAIETALSDSDDDSNKKVYSDVKLSSESSSMTSRISHIPEDCIDVQVGIPDLGNQIDSDGTPVNSDYNDSADDVSDITDGDDSVISDLRKF